MPGQPMLIEWTVRNVGNRWLWGSPNSHPVWHDAIYWSADNRLDESDEPIGEWTNADPEVPIGCVSPYGGHYTAHLTCVVPGDASPVGSRYVILCVDTEGALPELDEHNNTLARPVHILWSGVPCDVDQDNCVNVADLMFVRNHLGQRDGCA